MKRVKLTINIVLVLLGIFVNSQTFKVFGVQQHCENDEYDSRDRYLKIYQGDSLVIKNVKNRFGEFVLKNISEGDYSFEFTNVFGQEVKRDVRLSEKQNKIVLCVDQFQETNEKTLFSELKKEKKIEMFVISSGCFHFIEEKMVFYHKKDKIIAEFYVSEKLIKRKKLNLSSIEYFIAFEKRLRAMKNSERGCTSSDIYLVRLNNDELYITDNSCDWNGYQKLKKEIFKYKK